MEDDRNGVHMEIGLQYNDAYSENVLSFANNINTVDGGTHLKGFYSALTRTVNQLLKELRPHITTLVDAFAIPAEWKGAKILEEEHARQQAMAARDAEVRAASSPGDGAETPAGTATDLEVAPAQ